MQPIDALFKKSVKSSNQFGIGGFLSDLLFTHPPKLSKRSKTASWLGVTTRQLLGWVSQELVFRRILVA